MSHTGFMADWEARAKLSGDVVFFEYVTSELARSARKVFVWDLDKTYLDTHFESLRGLYRTIMEKAFQKRNVPGTSSLVRALSSAKKNQAFPIYFITASPPQLEEKIREKLLIDGIRPYGIFCKDNLKNLRPGRFARLNQQVGYKLQALLQLRSILAEDVQQILWGDDSESDATIYSLYSDLCARRLAGEDLSYILGNLKVRGQQLRSIRNLQDLAPERDPIERIYINLATDTDPDYYYKFGRRTLPTYNSFQASADLYQFNNLSLEQVLSVATDLVTNYGFSVDELGKSLEDLVKRKVLTEDKVEELINTLRTENLLPVYFKLHSLPPSRQEFEDLFWGKSSSDSQQWVPAFIDYLNDFR